METTTPVTSRSRAWSAGRRQRPAAVRGAEMLLLGLLALPLLASSAATADGLLANGDFAKGADADKTWAAGWQATEAQRAHYRWVDDDGANGPFSLRYEAKTASAAGAIAQTVPCQKNTEYVLTVALKSDGTCLPLVQVVARLKRLQDSGRISHDRYHDEEFYRHQN